MKNKKGKSINERLNEDIQYAEATTEISDRTLLATKALGAADLAVEFGLITYTEWEQYIDRIFKLI